MKKSNEQLVELFQSGDHSALDLLLAQNQGLIYKVALKAAKTQRGEFDDIFQEVQISFCRAAEKFDLGSGFKFSTYAMTAMNRQAIRLWQIENCNKNSLVTFSLNATVGEDSEYQDFIDGESEDPFETASFRDDVAKVHEAMKELDERDRTILLERAKGTTLDSLGELFGVSKERIRQREAIAKNKVREICERRNEVQVIKKVVSDISRNIQQIPIEKKSPAKRRPIRWTEYQDSVLRREYGYGKADAISKKIGVSVSAVRSRAAKLGVTKSHICAEKISKIVGLWKSGLTTAEISKLADVSDESIRTILKDCGVYDSDFTNNKRWRESQKRKAQCAKAAEVKNARDRKRSIDLVGHDWPLAAALVFHALKDSPANRDEIVERCQSESKSRGWHCVVNSWRTALKYTRWLRDRDFVVANGGGNELRTYSVKERSNGDSQETPKVLDRSETNSGRSSKTNDVLLRRARGDPERVSASQGKKDTLPV